MEAISNMVAEQASKEPDEGTRVSLHALAVTLAAIEGWGDFTVDDFEEFFNLEVKRQSEIDQEVN